MEQPTREHDKLFPQTCIFLWACLSVFKVVLWLENPRGESDLVLEHILGGTMFLLGGILSYSIEDYAMTRLIREGNEFHGCYRDSNRGWEGLGDYGTANTLFIDTSIKMETSCTYRKQFYAASHLL